MFPVKSEFQVNNTGFCFLFFVKGPHPRHMEIPRLGFESELQLLAYSTATAIPDPSPICNLYHNSGQCRILNPLSEARDQTCLLMGTSRVLNPLSHNGNSYMTFYLLFVYCLLGPHLQHMEVPRLGVALELQLPAYTSVTAVPDLSSICNLHYSSGQCRIFSPLSEARGRTRILMDTS